ncbi:MAG TPA: TonB-dependent receptor [Candidatus Binataceae bacterium]|nr:TonB-dependent receptor [Candidatus Binataceae bacterium]
MRRFLFFPLAVFFLLTLDPSRLRAEDSSASPSVPVASSPAATATPSSKLPPMTIVITPTRIAEPLSQTGVTTSVVTQSDFQTQQIQSAVDAISEVPGVQVIQNGPPGTVATVQIRGATSSQSLIMIDGVPVNDSATDLFDISRLTTNSLDRVEVVRGAGGSLYGSQAIGGVVNLISHEGSGAPKFSLLSEGGNRATQNQVATVEGAEGKLAYSGALSYFSTTAYRTRNDSSDNLNGSLRLDYHLDENTTIHGFARYIRANVSLASWAVYSGIPVDPNAHQRNEFFLFKGGIDHQFGEHLLLRTSTFWVRDDVRDNALPLTGYPYEQTDHNPDETRGTNIDTIYTWNKMFRTLVGFEFLDRWTHSQDDFVSHDPSFPGRTLTIYNARRQEYAGYVEQEGHFFDDHLIATGGFRVDGNSNFGEEVSPAWSVAMPVGHGFTFRGNYAEGFRAPSFNDLYFPGFGNPNLAPELSSEYDGGVTKTFGENFAVTTTYFSRRVHSQIIAVPCKYNPSTCPFDSLAGNAGRVDTQGIEFVPEAHPIRGLTLKGSFTFIDQSHSSPLPNERPLRVPKYSASSVIEYVHRNLFRDDDEIRFATNYTFIGDRDDITTTGVIANHAAYNVVDGALSYSPGIRWSFIRNETVLVRVQNVMDRHYSETFGFPAPPVNFVSGVKLDF